MYKDGTHPSTKHVEKEIKKELAVNRNLSQNFALMLVLLKFHHRVSSLSLHKPKLWPSTRDGSILIPNTRYWLTQAWHQYMQAISTCFDTCACHTHALYACIKSTFPYAQEKRICLCIPWWHLAVTPVRLDLLLRSWSAPPLDQGQLISSQGVPYGYTLRRYLKQ